MFAWWQDQVETMPRAVEHSCHRRHACCKDRTSERHAFDGLKKRTSMRFPGSSCSFEASRGSDRRILLTTSLSTFALMFGNAMPRHCRNSLVVSYSVVDSFREVQASVALSSVNLHRTHISLSDASNPNEKQPCLSVCRSASWLKLSMTSCLRVESRPRQVLRFIRAT